MKERTLERAQTKLRRTLIMIDQLAALRHPATAAELQQRLADRGERVHIRTINRDLQLLTSLGMLVANDRGRVTATRFATTYRLRHGSLTNLLEVTTSDG